MIGKSCERSDQLLVDDENGSTFSLLLIVIILAGLVVGGYLAYNFIQDAGGLDELGEKGMDGIIGFVAGGLSSLWSGKKGIKTSVKTIWSKSKWFNWW